MAISRHRAFIATALKSIMDPTDPHFMDAVEAGVDASWSAEYSAGNGVSHTGKGLKGDFRAWADINTGEVKIYRLIG
jgi:hypothetical protein